MAVDDNFGEADMFEPKYEFNFKEGRTNMRLKELESLLSIQDRAEGVWNQLFEKRLEAIQLYSKCRGFGFQTVARHNLVANAIEMQTMERIAARCLGPVHFYVCVGRNGQHQTVSLRMGGGADLLNMLLEKAESVEALTPVLMSFNRGVRYELTHNMADLSRTIIKKIIGNMYEAWRIVEYDKDYFNNLNVMDATDLKKLAVAYVVSNHLAELAELLATESDFFAHFDCVKEVFEDKPKLDLVWPLGHGLRLNFSSEFNKLKLSEDDYREVSERLGIEFGAIV